MFVRGTLGTLLMAGMTNVPLVNADAESAHATSPVVDVWTEPADGYGFLDSAIASAHHSIDLSMYELSDATIEHELIARADAGVDVRCC